MGSAVIARRPRAAVAFESSPRALGPPDVRVGGRLQAFLPAWATITDDAFVLSVIRGGFSIELADPLPGSRRHRTVGQDAAKLCQNYVLCYHI